jgi:hypothetical protein
VQHYDGMYPLDCDAGPMNGDNNIIQLPKDKGLQGYVGRQILFKNLHKEKGYSRKRDEEDTKVRYDITINTVRANYIVRRSDDEITDVGQLRIIRQ